MSTFATLPPRIVHHAPLLAHVSEHPSLRPFGELDGLDRELGPGRSNLLEERDQLLRAAHPLCSISAGSRSSKRAEGGKSRPFPGRDLHAPSLQLVLGRRRGDLGTRVI